MEDPSLKIIIWSLGALVVVLGWFVAHSLSIKRDRQNKKKDIRTEYLISAYRQLSNSSHRDSTEPETKGLENAIHDIQLFGTIEQVNAVERFIAAYKTNGGASLDELLLLLREDLRKELELEPLTNDQFLFFRWPNKANNTP